MYPFQCNVKKDGKNSMNPNSNRQNYYLGLQNSNIKNILVVLGFELRASPWLELAIT
jgi:hypothetical protein